MSQAHPISGAPALQALAGVRVLEVAGMVAAPYCCKLLASLGAQVIKAEPPATGDPSRRIGPFPGDIPHPERSGLFLYLNTGKKSITLNLDDPEGRVLLGMLAATVDVVVHDGQPAEGRARGLDPDSLSVANPRLAVAALTPFGSTGPYADYPAYHINVFHAGGEGYLLPNGLALDELPERAPITAGSSMGLYQGGVTAALGIVAALVARQAGSAGQAVDCALREAQLAIGYLPIQRLEAEGTVEDRFSRYFRVGGTLPARDGYVELLTMEPRQWDNLVRFLGSPAWARPEVYQQPEEHGAEFNGHLKRWTGEHTREWLYREGQAQGVPIGPYYTPAEVFHDSHQRERGSFTPIEHPLAGRYDYFVSPFRFSETPEQVLGSPALGEHNKEVDGALGYSPQEIVALARAGAI